MSVNYQKILEKKIKEICKESKCRPRLLLHTCCAPCSSYCLEYLSDFFDITVYYYNPNITEKNEYDMRVSEQKRLIEQLNAKIDESHKIHFIQGDYNPNVFFEKVKGYENCPEGGERCELCFRLRLEKSLEIAIEREIEYYTTSLTISPLKNAQLINQIGMELADGKTTCFLNSDFKKNNGYKRSIELSKEYDLYRQDYCGCIYSKIEMEKRRNEKNN